jgi:hypothetical protein
MSASLEAYLARLYLDRDACAAFVADPRGAAREAGLNEAEVTVLERVDRVGLELTARSLAAKQAQRMGRSSWLGRLFARWRRLH